MTGRVKRAAKQVDTEPGKWPTNGLDYKPIKWPTNPIDVPTPSLLGQSQRTTIGKKMWYLKSSFVRFLHKSCTIKDSHHCTEGCCLVDQNFGSQSTLHFGENIFILGIKFFFFYKEFYYHVTILIDFKIVVLKTEDLATKPED